MSDLHFKFLGEHYEDNTANIKDSNKYVTHCIRLHSRIESELLLSKSDENFK